jgi:hypothetical protein
MTTCLELARTAAKGRLTEQEILDAFDSEAKVRRGFIESGKTDNLDDRVANALARDAMEKKIEAARMKRQVAQNIIVREKLNAHIQSLKAQGLSPRKALIATWEGTQRGVKGGRVSGSAQALAYEAKYLGGLTSQIEREQPQIMKQLRQPRFDEAVTRELYELREGGTPGKTGIKDAQYMAKTLATYMELARNDLNRLGAAIGKLDGYAGPQTHDDLAMLKAGRDKWIGDIKPLLNLERSFPDANLNEVDGILADVYDTLITGLSNKPSPALMGQRVGPANLGKRLGRHRVLHFTDADASLRYRDTYGRGSTIQGIIGQLRHNSRHAGAMETYGPNPEVMFRSLVASEQKALKEKISGLTGKPLAKARKELERVAPDRLTSLIDSITGTASVPVDVGTAQLHNNIRSGIAMAKLGGAALSAMPSDTVTAAAASMFRGGGFWNGLFSTLEELANRKNGREIGYLLGEGFDGLTGHVGSAVVPEDSIGGRMANLSHTFFKWSGLSGWTDAVRAASARVTSAHLGANMEKSFDKLDARLRHVLGLNGFDAAKWDAIRASGYKEVNNRHYVMPDRIRLLDDAQIEPLARDKIAAARSRIKDDARFETKRQSLLDDARRGLEMDLRRYFADETTYAVVETDAASRRMTTGGYRPATLPGETMRYVMQFKGFPLAFAERVLGRAALGGIGNTTAQRLLNNAPHIGALMAGLTVAGYMAMTMKDMARGIWPPRDPFSPKTLGAALTQGGALGIYGDFLFGQQSRFGQGPVETLAGPGIGIAADLYDHYQDLREGKPSFAKWLDTAVNNTPYINLFYTRPVVDLLFLNALRETFNPGYLARQESRLKTERGQHYAVPRTLHEMTR